MVYYNSLKQMQMPIKSLLYFLVIIVLLSFLFYRRRIDWVTNAILLTFILLPTSTFPFFSLFFKDVSLNTVLIIFFFYHMHFFFYIDLKVSTLRQKLTQILCKSSTFFFRWFSCVKPSLTKHVLLMRNGYKLWIIWNPDSYGSSFRN